MGAPIPCLGHRSQTAAIMALLGEGHDQDVVARRVGIDKHKLLTIISNARNRGWMQGRVEEERVGELQPGSSIAIAAILPDDGERRSYARREAARRGISIEELVRTGVRRMLDDRLVDAVLDDADELRRQS